MLGLLCIAITAILMLGGVFDQEVPAVIGIFVLLAAGAAWVMFSRAES